MAADGEINKRYIVGEIDRLIAKSEEGCDDVSRIQLTVLRQIYIELADLKKALSKNPLHQVGEFTRKNPKTALILLVLMILIIQMWFVPILIWIGLPAEMIP